MHESFHEPLHPSKRKPRRLTGTPANKYSLTITLGIAVVGTLALLFYPNTEHARRSKAFWIKFSVPDPLTDERFARFEDDFFGSSIRNLHRKRKGEAPPKRPQEHHSAF